jgi:oxalate decarboxylase/phosphoglucose isomerase-like protein (cupin superfamily)
MNRPLTPAVAGIAALLAGLSAATLAQAPKPQPFARPLACAEGYCRLLEGVPQTSGMRSGLVRLKPGESVGEHSTGKNEEALVVLHGQGEATVEAHPAIAFRAPALVYVPTASKHNITNTGNEPLEYVFVVAPAQAP